MLRCAAEARLELARFYNNWSGAGARVRHLEAALAHARAGLALVPAGGVADADADAGVGAGAGAGAVPRTRAAAGTKAGILRVGLGSGSLGRSVGQQSLKILDPAQIPKPEIILILQ